MTEPEKSKALTTASPGGFSDLSLREEEVLHWLAQGMTNMEISLVLTISERTVEKHLQNVYAKLRVKNRVMAAIAAQGNSSGNVGWVERGETHHENCKLCMDHME